MEPEGSLPHSQVPVIRTNLLFYDEELLAPHPTPKLEDHPLSAVHNCLFNVFAATLHTGGHSSTCNPRTRHAVVTRMHLSRHKIHNWKYSRKSLEDFDLQEHQSVKSCKKSSWNRATWNRTTWNRATWNRTTQTPTTRRFLGSTTNINCTIFTCI